MIAPIKKQHKSCYEYKNSLLGLSGILQDEEAQLTDSIKYSFKRRLGYTEVYKNFDNSQSFETDIFEGDSKDKDVFYKRLLSYPYDSVKFNRGDYVHFKYGEEDSVWLLETLDKQHLYDINGRIYQCLQNLKWQDETGEIFSYPCVILDNMKNTTFDFNSAIINLKGTIFVDVQQNEDTMKLKESKRFIFDNACFKVNFIESFIGGNYLTITMERDPKAVDDNFDLGIANYRDSDSSTEVIPTEVRITPNTVTELLQNTSQTYDVYLYIDGVQQSNIFTITPSGIPNASTYYQFSSTDNSFTVLNKKLYSANSLVVTCTSGIYSNSINIKLKAW